MRYSTDPILEKETQRRRQGENKKESEGWRVGTRKNGGETRRKPGNERVEESGKEKKVKGTRVNNLKNKNATTIKTLKRLTLDSNATQPASLTLIRGRDVRGGCFGDSGVRGKRDFHHGDVVVGLPRCMATAFWHCRENPTR